MARERTGSIVNRGGTLYARVRFKDETGKSRDITRRAESRTHARRIIRGILREVENSSATTLDAAQMTFAELADRFIQECLKPAVYVHGRRVEGVRSVIPAGVAVEALKAHFGKQRVRSRTHGDIKTYKSLRLKTPTMHDLARHERALKAAPKAQLQITRTIAAVNRELDNRELDKMKRIFNWAIRQGRLLKSPFQSGEPLISHADEVHRERVLSRDEESRLLAAIQAEPLRQGSQESSFFIITPSNVHYVNYRHRINHRSAGPALQPASNTFLSTLPLTFYPSGDYSPVVLLPEMGASTDDQGQWR